MQFDVRYGRGEASFEVADGVDVAIVRKPAMPRVTDPEAAVREALRRGVDTPSLAECAAGCQSACIAICDITRPVPNHLFLRPMIETLMEAGIAADRITVLVATGLHRPNEGDELQELVGDRWVLERVRVANHFARRDEEHVSLGKTATRGTVVRLDRRFVEADLKIATGLVEPHFMAGYSGGRKVIAPGLAHAETISTFHNAHFMSDPAARNCNFDGNPLHEEQLEIVRMLGGAYAINTVIDESRKLAFVNFGEIVASHQQAVDFVRPYCEVELPRRYPVVVTSAAGYPLDKTYYQTVKGMVGAIDILQPGGTLVIASECSEGMGSEEFLRSQQRLVELGPSAFLESILQKSHADVDEWQSQMQLKPMTRGTIKLFATGLSDQERAATGVDVYQSLQAAVDAGLEANGERAMAVIPEGPYVVPFCRAALAS